MSKNSYIRLNSLWVGEQLGYIENLCLKSAMRVGHEFVLYSYTPDSLKGVPRGVEVRDAREVMPEKNLLRYSDSGSVALGANFFRYHLLAKGLGYWVDMDFCFLKPFDFTERAVMGFEYEGWINNAVMYIPQDHAMVSDLLTMPATNRCPPWFGPRRQLSYYWTRLTKGTIEVQDMPWGTYSAGMVTYLAKKHGLAESAQPPSVFYPLRWSEAKLLYEDEEKISDTIKDDTCAVHMWHSRLEDLSKSPPPKNSFMHRMCEMCNVDF